jgi:hypothetical protein
MAGANVAMTTSALLEYGIERASQIVENLQRWKITHVLFPEHCAFVSSHVSLRSRTCSPCGAVQSTLAALLYKEKHDEKST